MRHILYMILVVGLFSQCQRPISTQSPIHFPAAYVINGGENSISVINLTNFTVDRTVFIPNQGDRYAHHIYASPDHKTLAVAMPAFDFSQGHAGLHGTNVLGGVTLLDSKTLDVKSQWNTPYANHNAVFSPEGHEIWTATHAHNGELLVYSSRDGTLLHRANLGPDPGELVISPTRQLFVNLGESSFVARVPVDTKEEARMVKVDLFPTSVWPGNDTLVLVENKHKKSINFIDLRSNLAFDALDLPFSPGFTRIIGSELWICEPGSRRVHVYQKQGNTWVALAILEAQEDAHALGEYQENVLVVNQQGHSVSVFNAKSKQLIQHVKVGFKPNGIVVIP